jgi:hypothetical protein
MREATSFLIPYVCFPKKPVYVFAANGSKTNGV